MSQYAKEIHPMLASLNGGEDENAPPLPEEEDLDTIHVYPVEGGGFLLTRTPLEEEEAAAPVIESQPAMPAAPRTPPPFVLFLLLLCLFLVGDLADTQLIALMIPTATIAITPEVHTVRLHSTASLGRLLSPITLSQSLTVPATGHGHQDARAATGTLTFYNGLATVQQVPAGTIITGQARTAVVTEISVTIPPANPPSLGESSVPAHVTRTGSSGNIPAEDINTTLSSGLYVKNLTAFRGGQDARDFLLVTQADHDRAAATLQAKVSASMSAALQGQLLPGQALRPLPCSPAITADHGIGEEATALTVSVSETCTAVAYDQQQLQARATQLLTAQAAHSFGTSYVLEGNVQVSVSKAIASPTSSQVVLTFTCAGTFAYTLTDQVQQQMVIKKKEDETPKEKRKRQIRNRMVYNDWGLYSFVQMLSYKCEHVGKELRIINERDTTKTCHVCKQMKDMPLWQRTYRCENCGLVMDRDENSAINIYERFVARPGPHTL